MYDLTTRPTRFRSDIVNIWASVTLPLRSWRSGHFQVCSISVKQLTEHHLEFLSLTGGYTGSTESTLVKMTHCWKSHVAAQIIMCKLKPNDVVAQLPRHLV